MTAECPVTHLAAKWTLTTMYALMFYHMTPLSECLVTNITAISMFSILYVVQFIKSTLLKTKDKYWDIS
jgi:hypothetical protein